MNQRTSARRHLNRVMAVAIAVAGVLAGPMAWAEAVSPAAIPVPKAQPVPLRRTPTLGDPHRFFVTQFRSEHNPNERIGRNGNCGPVCVLMAARAFGTVQASQAMAAAQVRTTRVASTGRHNAGEATSVEQLARGARHFGLTAKAVRHSSYAALKAQVQAGGLAVTCVAPAYIDPSYRSLGHYVLVTAIDAQGVHISDPGRSLVYGGIRTVPEATFIRAWTVNDAEAAFIGRPLGESRTASRQLPRS